MAPADSFLRYRPLVPDWPAFQDALQAPLPLCIWTNTLRCAPDDLRAYDLPLAPLAWSDSAFRLPAEFGAGTTVPYLVGLYHVQEEVSMLPVDVLAPEPGHRVLDLCAAPGNKTAQIGVRLRNQGTVVANDRNRGRLGIASRLMNRLGIANTSLVCSDAARFTDGYGRFDRVLADVPCSCEGTSRKHPGALRRTRAPRRDALVATQRAILRRAVEVCRPGGRILYSTCTYAPEENEGVVDDILNAFGPDHLKVCPIELPDFHFDPGLTAFEGRDYHPSLVRSARVWPHRQDTGGFYMALLERRGPAPPASPSPAPPGPSEHDTRVYRLFETRFGIERAFFDPFTFHTPNDARLYIVARDHHRPDTPDVMQCGLPFLRLGMAYPKPTTAAILLTGRHARLNCVDVDFERAISFLSHQKQAFSRMDLHRCTGRGYVIVRHRGVPLGLGFLDSACEGGTIRPMLPKFWRYTP